MPCSPEILGAILNWIEFIRLATACVSHSGNWFQVFCACSGYKFFSFRALIVWNKTENNWNNMKTVLFLLYSGSFGTINSYYCRPIKLEKNTWFGVSVILPCCSLPGLWCHESRSAVEAQIQLWTAVKAKINFAISCNFRPLLPWERNGGEGGWLNWVLKIRFWKYTVGQEVAISWTLLATHLTTAIADEMSAATSPALQGSDTSKGNIRSSLWAAHYPRTVSLVGLGRTQRCKQKDITFLAVKMVSWWAPKQGECFVLPPTKGCLHHLVSILID